MNPVLITHAAMGKILSEYHGCDIETGGAACGTIDAQVIVHAGSCGPRAARARAQFVNDPEHDLRTLTEARHKHGQAVCINGYWHVHCFYMPFASSVDCATTRRIFTERGGYPLNVGIVCPTRGGRNGLSLHLYRLEHVEDDLKPMEYSVVGDDDARIARLLKKSPATLVPAESHADFWDDPGFQFYNSKRGRQRIKEDLGDLATAGFDVGTYQRNESSLVITVRHGKQGLVLCPPPEFPINPPRVYAPSGHEFVIATLAQWNSERRLLHLVRECFVLLKHQNGSWPRFLSRTSKLSERVCE